MAGNSIPWNKHALRPTMYWPSDPVDRSCPVRSKAAGWREGEKGKSCLTRPWSTRAEKGTARGQGWEPHQDQGVTCYGVKRGVENLGRV